VKRPVINYPHKIDNHTIMTPSTKRTILRTIHIILAIPIAGYVYSPFEDIPQYAGPTRFVFFPVLVLTGLWMWKGHAIARLFSKSNSTQTQQL
jgi:hypothetical protein